jgi:uncharacterized protein YukE
MSRQLVILGTSVTLPDPGSVTDLAASFQQQGWQLADLQTALQSTTRPDAWGAWTGQAADAFGQSIGQLPAQIGEVSDAYDEVASALQQYAGQLEPVANSLSSLSYQAEDAQGVLVAVQNARSQAIANGQDPAATGWDARVADASDAVSALQGQLYRLLGELTALAAVCTKKINAAEPARAGKSLFGELERDFVRDVTDPLARAAVEQAKLELDGAKELLHLLDQTFVEPFTKLGTDLAAFGANPDLHTLGQFLDDYGAAIGVIALVALAVGVIIVASVGTGGAADVAFAAASSVGDVAGDIGIAALDANIAAVLTHEDGASWSDVSTSALSVVSDEIGDQIEDPVSSLIFGVVGGVDITALGDGLKYVLSIPQVAPAAPDVVSGLQVTTDSVQGLQGLPVGPSLQAAGSVSVLQPAVSVPSPAVVNIQHVALSPQPGGAPGNGAAGPEGNM